MDPQFLRKKIEEVFARQVNLSPRVKLLAKQKLEAMDWDSFKAKVMASYTEKAREQEGDLSPEECNALLMDVIRAELESTFGSAPGSGREER